ARHFGEALRSGELLPHIGASLARSVPGFVVGSLAGVVLGLLAGVARSLDQLLSPVVFLTYPVPKIVFLPIVMLWVGIGDVSKIAVIALACFYPCFINAYYGARGTSTIMVWSGLSMGARRSQIFRKVVVPSALPLVFAGLRVSLALSFILPFLPSTCSFGRRRREAGCSARSSSHRSRESGISSFFWRLSRSRSWRRGIRSRGGSEASRSPRWSVLPWAC